MSALGRIPAQGSPPPTACFSDATAGLLLCTFPEAPLGGDPFAIVDDEPLRFAEAPPELDTRSTYSGVTPSGKTYRVEFTRRPIVHVDAPAGIVDEPKRPSVIRYVAAGESPRRFFAGIELRGATALSYPKKSFDIEFWVDSLGIDEADARLAGLREDDDYVLRSLYNEPLRLNSYLAHELWDQWAELPWQAEEPDARANARMRFVEVFVGDRYEGLYHLGEQIDRKLLQVKKPKDGVTRGTITKVWAIPQPLPSTATTPPNPGDFIWSGYELKYPKPRDTIDWSSVLEIHDFFTASTPVDPEASARVLDERNAIDYNLFVNVVGGGDNVLKNMYIARYEPGAPQVFIPWDLDGTFGNNWDGTRLPPTDTIYTPLFHDALFRTPGEGLTVARCERYRELRTGGLIDADRLAARAVSLFDSLNAGGQLRREAARWPSTTAVDEAELDYTQRWVGQRIAFLDAFMCEGVVSARELGEQEAPFRLPRGSSIRGDEVLVTLREAAHLQVFDLHGRAVASGPAPAGEVVLDAAGWPPGVYVLRVGRATARLLRL